MKIFYVYYRLLGKKDSYWHCMKIEADTVLEAKFRARQILDRKSKVFVIQYISEHKIDIDKI